LRFSGDSFPLISVLNHAQNTRQNPIFGAKNRGFPGVLGGDRGHDCREQKGGTSAQTPENMTNERGFLGFSGRIIE